MSNTDKQPVQFTRTQAEYLDKLYPERTGLATTPADELRFYAGQRSLVQFVKSKVQKEN